MVRPTLALIFGLGLGGACDSEATPLPDPAPKPEQRHSQPSEPVQSDRAAELAVDAWTLIRGSDRKAMPSKDVLARGEALVREALALSGDDAFAYRVLGAILSRGDDLEGAEKAYRRAIELDPGMAEAHSALGWVLSVTDRDAEARKHLERAMALAPDDAQSRHLLALMLRAEGKLDEALQLLERAAELAPRDSWILDGLAGLLAERGRFEDALEAHRKSLSAAPNDWQGHYAFAFSLSLHGQVAASDASNDVAEALGGPKDTIERLRATNRRLHEQLGRTGGRTFFDDARACYDQLLADRPGAEGRVVVRFAIAGNGSLESAKLAENTLEDDTAADCVLDKARGWTFNAPKDGKPVSFSFPFVFKKPT